MKSVQAIAPRAGCAAHVGLFAALLLLACGARAQDSAPAGASTAANQAGGTAAQQKSATEKNEELTSHDNPTTFKVRVNLVLVRVVVRDDHGRVVENLHKEDFQLFDNRKSQIISAFSLDTPESHAVEATTKPAPPGAESAADEATGIEGPKVVLPQRFVAVMFDDIHLQTPDAVTVRNAATKLFASLRPSDRVGIYSTSGHLTQDFTSDRASLEKALLGVVPRPLGASGTGFHDCPEVTYYQSDLILNRNDQQALAVAAQDAVQCAFNGDGTKLSQAQGMAFAAAARALSQGELQAQFALRQMENVIRRLAGMPGQRTLVLVSPGFILASLNVEASQIIDKAARANVVIDTLDARGLYVPDILGDIADPPVDSFRTAGYKATYRIAAQPAEAEVLDQFAAGTGGTYFHNRNDLDEGLRQAVAAPKVSYLLGFSPQNLKLDGRYHTIKVSLANKLKYAVQARRGYFAPKTKADPVETAREEIQEALFSQEEISDLPLKLQTQFFKKDETSAKLAVLAHLDLKGVRFRKAEGRNRDDLTIAAGIFDENGNFVTGGEKVVEMRLLDATYDRLSRSGVTVKSSFDVKPGSYLVRVVVRDAEGEQMAARNGAVVIPF